MKHKDLLLIPLISLLFSCAQSAPKVYKPKELDPNKHYDDVYLIMGQSNASGVSEYSYLESSHPEIYQRFTAGEEKVEISFNTVQQWNRVFKPTTFGCGHDKQYFGPEIGIADYLSSYEEKSYIIKASLGATSLQADYITTKGKKKELYLKFVKFIKEQISVLETGGKSPRIRGVFWMQGESDSFLMEKGDYYTAENYLLNYLRVDLNDWIYDHFNFVDAYIFTRGICWTMPELINNAKQRLADENEHCYCIKTNGEDEEAIYLKLKCESGEEDDLAHYDSSSMLLLGQTAGIYLVK